MLPKPPVSDSQAIQGRSIWCVFDHLIPFACTTDSSIVHPRDTMNDTGHRYANNIGKFKNKQDFDRAYPLFVLPAKHNHADAAYRAGTCCENGWGCRHESAKALQFYRKAGNWHAASAYRLGECYDSWVWYWNGLHARPSAVYSLLRASSLCFILKECSFSSCRTLRLNKTIVMHVSH